MVRIDRLVGLGTLGVLWLVGCGGDRNGNAGDPSAGSGGAGGTRAISAGTSAGGSANGAGGSGAQGSGGGPVEDADCMELAACCATVTDSTLRGVCSTGSQVDCGGALTILIAHGQCQEDPGKELPPVTLDGAWSQAAEVDNLLWQGQTVSILPPLVLSCGDGDAVAAWHHRSGDIAQIQGARYQAAAGSWQVSPGIDQNSGYQPEEPALAVNAACDAIVAWKERLPVLGGGLDEYTLMAARLVAGTFSTPSLLQPLSAESTSAPQSVLPESGSGAVLFSRGQLYRQAYSISGAIGEAQAVSAVRAAEWNTASLVDGTTLLVATVQDSETNRYQVTFQLFGADWSESKPLTEALDAAPNRLTAAAAGDRFYVRYTTGAVVNLVSVTKDGVVSKAEALPNAGTDLQLVGSGENVLVVWKDGNSLLAMQRGASQPWTEPVQVSFEGHETLGFAAAVAADGSALVAYRGNDSVLFANRLTAAGQWLGVHEVASPGSEPRLHASPSGVFWLSYNGTHGGLASPQVSAWVQHFTPTP